MAKPEWGAKHLCESCGLKYYDMQRKPIACPSCGEKAVVVTARSRRGRTAVKPEPAATPAPEKSETAADTNPDDDNAKESGAGDDKEP